MNQRFVPFIIIFILILLAVGAYFLWWPKYLEFKDKKIEIEGKEENIRVKEEYLSKLESHSNRLANYSDEVDKINIALPADPSIAALFIFFQKTSSENGLILDETDLGRLYSPEALGALDNKIKKMPFSLSLTGSYPALKSFLSAIYLNSRLVEVTSLGFSHPEEGLFSFNLALETYTYQPTVVEDQEEMVEYPQ